MREITTHRVNPANDKIAIIVNDEPGAGGANHRYELSGFNTETNPSRVDPVGFASSFSAQVILFQNGPIPENGTNGVTQEVLLAIVIDRLKGFQFQRTEDGSFDEAKRGPFACKENACALTHLEEALMWLQSRTLKRMARGVEGTHQK